MPRKRCLWTFTITHDITKYTRAKLFSHVGKKTRTILRFSTVGGEKGSADTERDPAVLFSNIVGAMSGITSPKKSEITNRQLGHFFRADIGLGMAIVQGLGINPDEAMPKQHAPKEAATV